VTSIIHELTLIQEREGWLPEPALRELAERLNVPLHRVESVSTFYTHFRRRRPEHRQIAVCRDLSCWMAGGAEALARLRQTLVCADGKIEFCEVSCIGRCDNAPAAFSSHAVFNAAKDDPLHPPHATLTSRRWAADVGDDYGGLRTALAKGDRDAVVATLKSSGLRGMGGAGFPTGTKWELVKKEPATPKYVICNADESEPGTFKDREVLASLPHLVIEGMALGAWAVGSSKGWVFIRHEYAPEREALAAAIERAYSAGALGKNIFGSGFDFELEIFVSPGGYILGEETALLECMEDKRGEPRNKPPFPGTKGLHGQPTLINNVETFAHAAGITKRGLDWWKSLGKPGFAGHKFISVSGDVEKPGVYLIAMGATLRELLAMAGGMKDGKKLIAIAPGGASSNFLPPDKLDVPMDFKTLAEAGSMLGSGAAVFVGEGRDLLAVGLNVAKFFRNESCGKCVPCRVGSEKAVRLVESKGAVSKEDEELLRELDTTMYQTSICGLGQVALGPLLSILKNFPNDVKRG
jgi:formate dehydrogenase/NADH-quinone oxidoreductase subunit F